jgi:hypothetical protein
VLQIVSLGSFLGFGLFALNWNSNPGTYAAIMSVVLLTQSVFIHFLKMPWSSLKSGLITGLGLCLLFALLSMVLGGFCCLSSHRIQVHPGLQKTPFL